MGNHMTRGSLSTPPTHLTWNPEGAMATLSPGSGEDGGHHHGHDDDHGHGHGGHDDDHGDHHGHHHVDRNAPHNPFGPRAHATKGEQEGCHARFRFEQWSPKMLQCRYYLKQCGEPGSSLGLAISGHEDAELPEVVLDADGNGCGFFSTSKFNISSIMGKNVEIGGDEAVASGVIGETDRPPHWNYWSQGFWTMKKPKLIAEMIGEPNFNY